MVSFIQRVLEVLQLYTLYIQHAYYVSAKWNEKISWVTIHLSCTVYNLQVALMNKQDTWTIKAKKDKQSKNKINKEYMKIQYT